MSKQEPQEEELKGPTAEEINEATKDMEIKNPKKPAISTDCMADVSFVN